MTTTPFPQAVSLASERVLPSRRAAAILTAGAVAIGAYYLIPPDAQEVLYVLIGLTAVLAAGTRAWLRADARSAWLLFTAGLACSAIGDAISAVYAVHLNESPPTPSVADGFYLACYPFLAAGIVVLLWELGGRSLRIAVFDTVIVTAAAVLVQWVFFVAQFVHQDLQPGERIVDMAYPSLDVLLLVGVLQLISGPARKSTSYRLIVLALLCFVVGDEIYGIWASSYTAGDWMDAFWLAAYVCWAGAALDVAPAALGPTERRSQPRLSVGRVTVIGAAVLAPAVVLVIERLRHDPTNAFALGGAGFVISSLALVRFIGLMRAYERSRQEERSARRDSERAQALLALQNKELKELDRLKDEFVSGISHELRTPLTSITGYVDLLRELQERPEAEEYLGIVERNAERLLALVDDLLFAARVQAGELAIDVAPVDLRVVVGDAVASARPSAERAGIALRADTDTVPIVRGDARRLQQVVDNLISNAIKFTPSGGTVDVALRANGEHVAVEVRDTGMGLAEDDQRRLFERFFRAPVALDRQIPGTGLGLYISKAIVESHGGAVSVRSALGEGSTFRVELPAG
jgi:signal transduction histidine kinase